MNGYDKTWKNFFTGDPSILKEFDTPKSIYLQSCSGFGSYVTMSIE